ncbi:FAD-dependent tricarballylate dehydrogenase TcuA [Microbacterium aoyamense]|uniref:FAD-dependent tricarballylate dehydrogenase TcuA n=1 Tax=Microbacterium aoyamense TaxID=344166 RepID=A0ABP5B4Y7_9MICO|nr:FAD-dependent tricarballylate dehydrogenase TcuA [Microbacterium aoyamense]
MSEKSPNCDVLVVGAGTAGLTAAIAARERGASVILLEPSTAAERGGNSRYASAVFRAAHNGVEDLRHLVTPDQGVVWDRVRHDHYPAESFVADVKGAASSEHVDEALVSAFVARSLDTLSWLGERGVVWRLVTRPGDPQGPVRLPRGGELIVEGNGVGLVEALFATAERAGIDIRYNTRATDLVDLEGEIRGAVVESTGTRAELRARSTVLAAGGFEADAAARAEHLGAAWADARVRGTGFNTGTMLYRALAHGAAAKGDWSAAHAVPIDTAAPSVGDLAIGDSTARYSFSFGILVNADGRRFLDEGADEWPFLYSELGRRILAEPGGIAFQIFDESSAALLEPRYATAEPVFARTVAELATGIGVDPRHLNRTIEDFNASCPDGAFDPGALDGLRAEPLGQPPKSNWATPLTALPLRAYPVTCGITFTTGGGLSADENGRVLARNGAPVPGLFAAGEILGGYFRSTVPTGAGLMRSATMGRAAGESAAARSSS